jgi:hypothetical protein
MEETWMKLRLAAALAASALTTATFAGAAVAQADSVASAPSALFVLTASAGSTDATDVTLEGTPSVLWFSDRPERLAGHIDLSEFAMIWDAAQDGFAEDPPNAVLTVLRDGQDTSAVVELTTMRLRGGGISFAVNLLEGQLLDGSFESAALFVDNGALLQLVAQGVQDAAVEPGTSPSGAASAPVASSAPAD